MANEIWSKKELTQVVIIMAEKIEKLNEQLIRTTKLISMIFDSLSEETKQQILTELIKVDKEKELEKETEEEGGASDGEGDAV